MKRKNSIAKYSIIMGVLVCCVFPLLIFTQTLFIELLIGIADFGIFGNQLFWGIIFPLFIVFLFWRSATKIIPSLNQITYFKVSLKLLFALFTVYIIGILVNGISSVLQSQIPYQILFSMLMILFLSLLLMIMTFISSLIIIKMSQNPQHK